MRIDLVLDFHEVLKKSFQAFIKELDKRDDKGKTKLSTNFIYFKGESIFKGTLRFCCNRAYYGLKPRVFEQVEKANCIIFRRHYNEWEPCVDVHDKMLIRTLSQRYEYQERDSIRLIDLHFIRGQSIQFYIGFYVGRLEGQQLFYIWYYSVPISEVSQEKKATLEAGKLKYLAYYKLFLDFIKKQEKAGAPSTVAAFYKSNTINRKTFQKQFKAYVGTTFYDYHLQTRLLTALKLILATPQSIKAISIKVGCNDYSVLVKAFRQKQFLPPSKYRNSPFL